MLEEKIYNDYIKALKAKHKHKVQFLSFLRAELKNKAIELKKETLEDGSAIDVLKKQKKRLLDAKEQFEKSKRKDLLDELNTEIAIIDEYLPESLPIEKIQNIVDEVIRDLVSPSMKDMGRVMKLCLEKLQGKAEAREVSQIVKERLSNPS